MATVVKKQKTPHNNKVSAVLAPTADDVNQQPKSFFPYNPVVTFLFTILVFVLSSIFAAVALSFYASLRGIEVTAANNWLSDSVTGNFWSTFLTGIALVFLIYVLLKYRHVGLGVIGVVKLKLRDVGYALAGFAVYFPLLVATTVLISLLIPSIDLNQTQELGFSTSTTGWPLLLVFVSLVILPPIAEELIFRGFLYTGLRTKLRPVAAGILVSLLFAAAHLPTSNGQPALWAAGVDTFILSMILVYLREKTGSLWSPIFLHMIKNSIAFLALFIIPNIKFPV